MQFRFVTALCALALLGIAGSTQAASLKLTVDNIRNDRGDIWIMLYRGNGGFSMQSTEAAEALVKLPARNNSLKVRLYDLPKGDYAAAVFHDENGNGKYDERREKPTEGYGFSRNPSADRVPSFSQASFFLNGDNDVLIRIKYPKKR